MSSDTSANFAASIRPGARPTGMSYKFQRLREKLREAVRTGELSGKLPGERALAKRFQVNAKTLSKALTDLAAEGLLDRSIGRGTYVKGAAPSAGKGRWLVVTDSGDANNCIVGHLRAAYDQIETTDDVSSLRPSYLNQFVAVIDAGLSTPENFIRDMVVRNLPVVSVGREPRTYSVHTVLPDKALGVTRVARELLLSGHRKIGVIEAAGDTFVTQAVRQAANRFASETIVDAFQPNELATMVDHGVTAIVCDSSQSAQALRVQLEQRSGSAGISLAAIGTVCAEPPCSGWFVPCHQIVDGVQQLLQDGGNRPTSLWLAGSFVDRGSIRPVHETGENGSSRIPSMRVAAGIAS